MSFRKKIVLSLSLLFSFIIISVVGVVLGTKTTSLQPSTKPVSVEDSGDDFIIIKNDNKEQINFTYNPHADAQSTDSVSTKVYEFAFGNSNANDMAVELTSKLSSSNINVSYMTSPSQTTVFSDATSTYTIPTISQGETMYVYVILSVVDTSVSTTFSKSLNWLYGEPVTVTYNIMLGTALENIDLDYSESHTFIKTTKLSSADLSNSTVVSGGYGIEGWYMDDAFKTHMPATVQAYNGLHLYAKIDVTGEFNVTNNPSWFALMFGSSDSLSLRGGTTTDIEKLLDSYSAVTDEYGQPYSTVINGQYSTPWFLQVIRGNGTLKDIDGQLIIPSHCKAGKYNIPVKKIESLDLISDTDQNPRPVFSGQKFKNLIISEGVEELGYGCFNECDNITYVEVPSTVFYVNRWAFQRCDNLLEVKFRASTVANVQFEAGVFNGSSKLERVTLPTNLQIISEITFNNCTSLRQLEMPINTRRISQSAFEGCTALTTIKIPEYSQLEEIGFWAFRNCTNLTNTIYGSTTNAGFDLSGCNELESIGDRAFHSSGIKSITLPSSLKSLHGPVQGDAHTHAYAFQNCTNLVEVNFEEGNTSLTYIPDNTFDQCTSLETITNLPDSITKINKYAFRECSSLTTITTSSSKTTGQVALPSSTTSIGAYTFYKCGNITKLVIPNALQTIEQYAFNSCVKLANITFGTSGNLKMIDRLAFSHCTSLKTSGTASNFQFPSGLEFIGHGTFWDCTSLQQITLPSSIVASHTGSADNETNYGIDAYAFQACTSLTSADLTACSKLTALSSSVFEGCSKLSNVKFSTTTTSFGNHAFSGCAGLTELSASAFYNGTLTSKISTGQFAFSKCTGLKSVDTSIMSVIGRAAFIGCTGLTTITISKNLTSIGDYAFQDCTEITTATFEANGLNKVTYAIFYNCKKLANVTLPTNIKTIDSFAFNGCYALKDSNITANITTINQYAFANCHQLTSINLASVTKLADHAFIYTGLTSVTIPSTIQSIGDFAFAYCTALKTIDISNLQAKAISQNGDDNGTADSIFSNCSALNNIAYPNIGVMAPGMFGSCKALNTITFAGTIDTLPLNVFNSAGLTTITLPSTKVIGEQAFARCTKLVSIEMPTVTSIGKLAFDGCSALAYTITDGVQDSGFITHQGLTFIGYGAFHNNKAMKKLEISSTVNTLAGHTFLKAGLTEVKFNNELGTTWFLYNCTSSGKGTTNTAILSIWSDGCNAYDSSTVTCELVKALTTPTYYTYTYPTSAYVYQYWEKTIG